MDESPENQEKIIIIPSKWGFPTKNGLKKHVKRKSLLQ